jgi:FdhD protein
LDFNFPAAPPMPTTVPTRLVHCKNAGTRERLDDELAAEEPLEIRVEGHSVAVVMRTPGEDRELAAGFLLSENLVKRASDIFDITQCVTADAASKGNVVDVALARPGKFNFKKLSRHVFTSSSCGICGKTSIDAVRQRFKPIAAHLDADVRTLLRLPKRLAAAQETFKRTGGLHACALFDRGGKLIALREDVGRHNALDKLIGWALLQNMLPLGEHILLLSGRVSFEMMQKALAAGIPLVAAIGAPSSLAVEFARESGQTLVGFLRGRSMNIYAPLEDRAA